MRILGIDPGYGRTGYGVIDMEGNRLRPVDFGLIQTASVESIENRLLQIHTALQEIIASHEPQVLVVEQLFFSKNVTTGISVAQARGVILLAGIQAGLEVFEYTPMQVKQAVVGYGGAEKRQIQEMVRILLSLPKIPKPDDVADALAVAITHAHTGPYLQRVQKQVYT